MEASSDAAGKTAEALLDEARYRRLDVVLAPTYMTLDNPNPAHLAFLQHTASNQLKRPSVRPAVRLAAEALTG